MNSSNTNLNLARKWRPKNFDQIIGQDIPVKILQNSLYLKKLFPVYLFAGQRGCGKTTAARVFGAAINCENLKNFQENPSENKIPCMKCESCKSMMQLNHPDFIEIDAASHTGVDNVRQILESCSYMPIIGNKKIYLIDEAHMLSKAAFNAFLKILEEPPSTALFILATTEKQKFPDTVVSRCFQVIFKSVDNLNLEKHLQNICKDEEIDIEPEAINIIIQETDGSVRDAINLLERVRFSETKITSESLLKVLDKISEKELFELFETLLDKNPQELINKLSSNELENINSQTLWNSIIQVCRTLAWIKFKAPKLPTHFNNIDKLKQLAHKCSVNRINAILQLLWTQEEIFLKTPQKRIFLETVLLQISQQTNILDLQDIFKNINTKDTSTKPIETQEDPSTQVLSKPVLSKPVFEKPSPPEQTFSKPVLDKTIDKPSIQENKSQEPELPIKKEIAPSNNSASNNLEPWDSFLEKISTLEDPLLLSILNQSSFRGENSSEKTIKISLSNNSSFFKDKINDTKKEWISLLQECFPDFVDFDFIKNQKTEISPEIKSKLIVSAPPANNYSNYQPVGPASSPFGNTLDISDKDKWPKANLISKFFPGKIKVVKN